MEEAVGEMCLDGRDHEPWDGLVLAEQVPRGGVVDTVVNEALEG